MNPQHRLPAADLAALARQVLARPAPDGAFDRAGPWPAGRGARVLRRVLVAAQVAFAFVLLVGAGLLFASFRQVLAVDPGFTSHGVMTASISLPRSRYETAQTVTRYVDEALRRIRTVVEPLVTAGASAR